MDFFGEYWGLTKERTQELLWNDTVSIREFGRRQLLMGMDGNPDEIGILLEGTALLESTNRDDQRRILDYYEKGDLFWRKSFPDAEDGMYYYVSNQAGCRVAFLNYEKIFAQGVSDQDLWKKRLEDGFFSAQRKGMMHVEILGQHSIRQKLLVFLEFAERRGGEGASFLLPFSLTDCADYLVVDRSAMMRELKKMKEEGLLQIRGRRVWLGRSK